MDSFTTRGNLAASAPLRSWPAHLTTAASSVLHLSEGCGMLVPASASQENKHVAAR